VNTEYVDLTCQRPHRIEEGKHKQIGNGCMPDYKMTVDCVIPVLGWLSGAKEGSTEAIVAKSSSISSVRNGGTVESVKATFIPLATTRNEVANICISSSCGCTVSK
jgi:hypothetical protein